jgi:hypothetical protein
LSFKFQVGYENDFGIQMLYALKRQYTIARGVAPGKREREIPSARKVEQTESQISDRMVLFPIE